MPAVDGSLFRFVNHALCRGFADKAIPTMVPNARAKRASHDAKAHTRPGSVYKTNNPCSLRIIDGNRLVMDHEVICDGLDTQLLHFRGLVIMTKMLWLASSLYTFCTIRYGGSTLKDVSKSRMVLAVLGLSEEHTASEENEGLKFVRLAFHGIGITTSVRGLRPCAVRASETLRICKDDIREFVNRVPKSPYHDFRG